MAEDDLHIVDVEHAALTGRIVRIQRGDPRGNKYVLEGRLRTTRLWSEVGRFLGNDRYLIVTVYKLPQPEEPRLCMAIDANIARGR